MNEKERVTASLVKAQAELREALAGLEKMPAFDPGAVAFTAHALNNYLTVTTGTVELLRWSLTEHPDTQIRDWLDSLGHVTELMRHTVCRLMNSSNTKDAQLKFVRWDLTQLVQRTCRYYQRVADRKDIAIVCEPARDLPPVWTDPVAVVAVLDNLLSNAVKYSPSGKKVWARVWNEEDGVVCSICDEGPGLTPDDQTKLFQRGVQLSAVPTGGEPSSGYGLAVAKELMDKLGGTLWCESTLGSGACFSFRVPAYHGQEKSAQGRRHSPITR